MEKEREPRTKPQPPLSPQILYHEENFHITFHHLRSLHEHGNSIWEKAEELRGISTYMVIFFPYHICIYYIRGILSPPSLTMSYYFLPGKPGGAIPTTRKVQ